MTDPTKLAEEIEKCESRYFLNPHNGETKLIAAALRLAEAVNDAAKADAMLTVGICHNLAAYRSARGVR